MEEHLLPKEEQDDEEVIEEADNGDSGIES